MLNHHKIDVSHTVLIRSQQITIPTDHILKKKTVKIVKSAILLLTEAKPTFENQEYVIVKPGIV